MPRNFTEITVNGREVERHLRRVARRDLPRIFAGLINDVAFDGRPEEVRQMHRDMDRPTPFTAKVGTFKVIRANQRTLTATVSIQPIQASYLVWQVFGGTREPKSGRFWHVVPTPNQKRNQYGNVPGYRGILKRLDKQKTARISNRIYGGAFRRKNSSSRSKQADTKLLHFAPVTRYRPIYRFSKGFERYARKNRGRIFRHQVEKRIRPNTPRRRR